VQTDTQLPVAALHENGTQMCVEPGLHCPLPSQACAPTTASPSHTPGLHIVLTGYLRQPPAPSHFPSKPQVVGNVVTQVVESRGVAPTARFAHVPAGALGDAQLLQPPVHASVQQTPSTQKPLAHSALQVHGIPGAFAAGMQGGASTPLSRESIDTSAPPSMMDASPPSDLGGLLLQPSAPTPTTNARSAPATTRPTVLTNIIFC